VWKCGSVGNYFKSGKGVGQGDPLSPLLFNLAADSLAKMIHTTQKNGLIKGLVAKYIDQVLDVLQYADDIILCIEDDLESVQNMKFLLCLYEKMSGLKINFNKSETLMVSQDYKKQLCMLTF
jgi:retron-type reverse transcriptase